MSPLCEAIPWAQRHLHHQSQPSLSPSTLTFSLSPALTGSPCLLFLFLFLCLSLPPMPTPRSPSHSFLFLPCLFSLFFSMSLPSPVECRFYLPSVLINEQTGRMSKARKRGINVFITSLYFFPSAHTSKFCFLSLTLNGLEQQQHH